MASQTTTKLNDIFDSVETIQILYYLEEYNPNVTIETLSRELQIDSNFVAKILKNLLELEIIQPSEDKRQFSLTTYGRNIVNVLHELTPSNTSTLKPFV